MLSNCRKIKRDTQKKKHEGRKKNGKRKFRKNR
jgi:hypothetical protein